MNCRRFPIKSDEHGACVGFTSSHYDYSDARSEQLWLHSSHDLVFFDYINAIDVIIGC